MEERITVTIESGLEAERKAALERAVAVAFGLSDDEAQALLAADALVLAPAEARELAVLGHQLGIAVSLAAASARRPRRRGPWLAALAGAALLAVVALLLALGGPRVSTPAALEPLPASAPAAGEIEPLPPGAALPAAEDAPDLFAAAREQDVDEVRRALAAAPQVDLRDAYGQTPLMYAAGDNGAEVVALLLASGAQPNARSDAGWTPLMYAARNQAHPEVAEVLLEAGADPAARNASGQSARDIALAYSNDAVSALLPEAAAAEPAAEPSDRNAEPPSAEQPGAAAPGEAVARLEPAPDDPSRQTIERCLADWAACGRE